jgi:hypothetical protein
MVDAKVVKDMKDSGRDMLKVLSRRLPGGFEQNNDNLRRFSQSSPRFEQDPVRKEAVRNTAHCPVRGRSEVACLGILVGR